MQVLFPPDSALGDWWREPLFDHASVVRQLTALLPALLDRIGTTVPSDPKQPLPIRVDGGLLGDRFHFYVRTDRDQPKLNGPNNVSRLVPSDLQEAVETLNAARARAKNSVDIDVPIAGLVDGNVLTTDSVVEVGTVVAIPFAVHTSFDELGALAAQTRKELGAATLADQIERLHPFLVDASSVPQKLVDGSFCKREGLAQYPLNASNRHRVYCDERFLHVNLSAEPTVNCGLALRTFGAVSADGQDLVVGTVLVTLRSYAPFGCLVAHVYAAHMDRWTWQLATMGDAINAATNDEEAARKRAEVEAAERRYVRDGSET
jgi:hypothetical protein